MKLEDDPSIGLTRCPWCGQSKGLPCVPPDFEDSSRLARGRKFIPSHLARMTKAMQLLRDDLEDEAAAHFPEAARKLQADLARLTEAAAKRRRSKRKSWDQGRLR